MSHDTIIHFYPWPNFFYCIFFKLLKNLQLNYKINGVPAEFGVSIFLKLQLGTRSAWRAWWHSCNTKKAGWQNMAEAQLWDLTTALGNKSKLSDNIPPLLTWSTYIIMLEFNKLRKLMILKLYLARNSGLETSFEFYLVKDICQGK